MGQGADQLKTEIDQTRRELDDDLAMLKTEAQGLQRKVLVGAGIAVAVLVGLKVVRGILRSRDSD